MGEKKWLFVTDVDGTLIKKGLKLPEKVLSAIRKYKESGGMLTLCTGRSVEAITDIVDLLEIDMPCIVCCGAGIYRPRESDFIFARYFESDIYNILSMVARTFPNISIQAASQEGVYTIRRTDFLDLYGVPQENKDPEVSLANIKGNILKITMSCKERELLMRCKKQFFDNTPYVFTFASSHFVDITPTGCSKGKALEKLCELLHTDKQHVFAAGDGLTDLTMMQFAKYSYAPQNALPEVKHAVDRIVPCVESGGMELAFLEAAQRIKENM